MCFNASTPQNCLLIDPMKNGVSMFIPGEWHFTFAVEMLSVTATIPGSSLVFILFLISLQPVHNKVHINKRFLLVKAFISKAMDNSDNV
jgi:hypothetical protein